MNQVIRQTSNNHQATVIDIESYFEVKSGDSLFTDHLHPTALGYDRMARAFIDEMGIDAIISVPDLAAPDPSPFDAAYARLLIARLRLGFPFEDRYTEEEESRQFEKILKGHRESGNVADSLAAVAVRHQLPIYEALLATQKRDRAVLDTAQALVHLRSLLYWQPFHESLHLQAAELASRQSSNLAGEVMQLVASRYPSEKYLNTLAALRLRQGAVRVSGILLRRIESEFPESPVMLYNMARYQVLTGDTLTAEIYFRRYQQVVGRE